MPANLASCPMGICTGVAEVPNVCLISSTTRSKFAFSRSILLMRKARAMFLSPAYSHTFSVPTSTPETAQAKTRATSAARSAPLTSPTKSK